ncbi:MAG: ABC transporter substrate-binding protein [Actinomycetota bacterium]
MTTTTEAAPSSTTQAPDTTVPTPESTTTTSTTTPPLVIGDPVRGGVVKVGLDAAVAETVGLPDGSSMGPSLNPLVRVHEAAELARLVVPGAYRLDADTGEVTPWLVERIPSLGDGIEIADDGTVTVTYTVREEAVWEDGTPVTGADLAFTHNLLTEHAENLERSSAAEKHALVDTDSMVVDGKSITFDLTEPDITFDRLFEWVLPAHIIDPDTFLDDWNDKLWPSAGPFRFVSFDRPNAYSTEPSVIALERNPTYWEVNPATGEQLPYLDGVEVYAFPGGHESNETRTLLTSGTLDGAMGWFVRDPNLSDLDKLDELGLERAAEWDTLYEVIAFNLDGGNLEVNPNSRNDLLDYRKAVLAAIDRSTLGGLEGITPIDSIVGLAVDRYGHDVWSQHDTTGQVGTLLAGVPEPHEAVYGSSAADATVAIGTWVADQLTTAGIDTTTDFSGVFWSEQFPERRLDIFALRAFASLGGLSGVAEMMETYLPGEGIVDWTGLDDEAARYTDLITEARSEFDRDRLAELITEAEAILADNALIYPLARRQASPAVYRPERIQGLIPNRYQGWNTWNAAMWWSPDA